jgi:hypothetical protein
VGGGCGSRSPAISFLQGIGEGHKAAAAPDRVTTHVAPRTIFCTHCGLVLTVEDAQGSTRISYDPGEWQRLCKHLDLGSPALCLLEGGGDGSGRPTH